MASELFVKQAATYANSRPTYPASLFSFLSSLTTQHNLAWDVGTGNGQAATAVSNFCSIPAFHLSRLQIFRGTWNCFFSTPWAALSGTQVADHYEKVIATDVSASQLAHARHRPNITYAATPAVMSLAQVHDLVGPEGSVDLVTVAQALHWFDLDVFYAHVRHVLRKPGGVIAAWSYRLPTVTPAVDAALADFYRITDPYWAPQRKLVDQGYATVPFPFRPVLEDGRGVSAPIYDFFTEHSWALGDYLRYLSSWSAVQTALDQGVALLSDDVVQAFARAWGDPEERQTVKSPIALLLGKVE